MHVSHKTEIVIFVTHANGKELEDGVGITARRYVGTGANVRAAIIHAAEQIPHYFPFRAGSSTKLTITIERTK